MYLVDTNIWLELMLGQQRAADVTRFLLRIDPSVLHITDFSLYSLSIILVRLRQPATLRAFMQDVIRDAGLTVVRLLPDDFDDIVDVATQHGLDFDDAYQYVAAERHGLHIVSFDADFDRTPRGRQTPMQIMAT